MAWGTFLDPAFPLGPADVDVIHDASTGAAEGGEEPSSPTGGQEAAVVDARVHV